MSTVLYSLHSILLPQAVEPDGSFAFKFSSIVLVSELVKFAIALGATLAYGHAGQFARPASLTCSSARCQALSTRSTTTSRSSCSTA
jgi:hypothetical protein